MSNAAIPVGAAVRAVSTGSGSVRPSTDNRLPWSTPTLSALTADRTAAGGSTISDGPAMLSFAGIS